MEDSIRRAGGEAQLRISRGDFRIQRLILILGVFITEP